MKKITLILFTILSTIQVVNSQEIVVDVNSGSDDGVSGFLTPYNNKLYFTGANSSDGIELISYDPALSSNNISSININTNNSSLPQKKVVYNGKLFFSATEASGQLRSLFSYDGTNLVNINASLATQRDASDLTVVNNKLYFSARYNAGGTARDYFYVYNDVTVTTPTITLVNINGQPNTSSGSFNPRNLVVVGNLIYFIAEHATDGTRVFYYNTNSGVSGHVTNISSPEYLFAYGNNIYLNGILSTNVELLKIETLNSNTVSVLPNNPTLFESNNIVGHQNILYYRTDNGSSTNGLGLYNIDNNNYTFKNTVPNNSQVNSLIKYAGKIYFRAFFSDARLEFAEYNPTTNVLRGFDTNDGTGEGSFSEPVIFNNELYFIATNATNGDELYKFNGTATVDIETLDTEFIGSDSNWSLLPNWTNGIPNINNNAVIPDGKDVTSNISNMETNRLVVENGGSLKLQSNANLNITKGLTNSGTITLENTSKINVGGNALINSTSSFSAKQNSLLNITGDLTNNGSLSIESNATSSSSLIIGGSYSGGSLTYKRYVTDDWHLIAPPTPANLGVFIGATPLATGTVDVNHVGLAEYNNTIAGGWDYHTNSTTGSFIAMKGYAVKRATAGTVDFVGSFRQASTLPISLNRGSLSDWNLVGNPYTSFLAGNTNANTTNNLLTKNSSELDPNFVSLYFWDPTIGMNGEYVVVNQMSNAQYVAPGQGFFVKIKTSGGNFTFEESMQSHQTGNIFYKNSSTTPEIDIIIASANDSKKTSIKYSSTSTKGLDPGFDAGQFNGVQTSNPLNLYTQLVDNNQGTNFALQALPEDYENIVIPIGLKAEANSEITFTLNHNNLPTGLKVFLEDKELNTMTRLDEGNSEYKITPTTNLDGIGRFYLHTSYKSVLNIKENSLSNVSIFNNDRVLNISGLNEKVDLQIFDLLGKQTFTLNNENVNNSIQINIPSSINTGIYIVKLKTKNGTLDKKIILE
ncbi:T9SS type A sorting domain-containing protein [Polaribacter porphyrae]|uniref:Secretion system C-terminal sorting domain-containing protein n=1 Tax=Polaribacter porphyrae TaxID=1137780 RepID=A0A2S7WS04_9FLAO|nr:T9SS type A sorting domain-containing protein [Polaribacter porphyrae]PQJ80364.1 hypothetical protein BTO18_14795 [Polaribacter porphyrae]